MVKPSMDEMDDFMATRGGRDKADSKNVGSAGASRESAEETYKKTGVQMRPEAHTQLKKLALDLGMKDRECLAAALNLLFTKHGKEPVA